MDKKMSDGAAAILQSAVGGSSGRAPRKPSWVFTQDVTDAAARAAAPSHVELIRRLDGDLVVQQISRAKAELGYINKGNRRSHEALNQRFAEALERMPGLTALAEAAVVEWDAFHEAHPFRAPADPVLASLRDRDQFENERREEAQRGE